LKKIDFGRRLTPMNADKTNFLIGVDLRASAANQVLALPAGGQVNFS
jgi:hypothetical protein